VSLRGKRLVVTGAGRGIGAGVAAELRARGAEVIGLDLVGADLLCDISSEAAVLAAFAEIATGGPIDGLANCAALLVARKPTSELNVDEWDRMMAVNVRGTFLCCRTAAAHINPAGGSIVNVASATAYTGSHGFAHYVASKGAVVSLSRALANEYGALNIRVNTIAPGFTPTPGSAALGTYDPTGTPLGRVMQPEDLYGTFCFLLSDDSRFMSGQCLVVDGGKHKN
jgi:NAD(P)-dependent dehydrogenase (short-subunit alcohol dehydrogenase family)